MALLFRLRDTGQLVQETVHCVYIDQIRFHLITEDTDDLLRLSLAQQAMIDVYAYELFSDRTD